MDLCVRGQVSSIHRVAEKGRSRKPGSEKEGIRRGPRLPLRLGPSYLILPYGYYTTPPALASGSGLRQRLDVEAITLNIKNVFEYLQVLAC